MRGNKKGLIPTDTQRSFAGSLHAKGRRVGGGCFGPGWRILPVLWVCLVFLGCRQDMHDQPKIEPLEAHSFFADGMGSRVLPEGTVARGFLREDTRLWEGKNDDGSLVDRLPVTLDRALVERGRERYDIYCSVCHDATGGGRGMIVRRGFKQPRPLYEQRLVEMPVGYFFDVMTNGFGLMSSYAKQVPVEDRWAIAAYIRALQVSHGSRLDELSPSLQAEFREALAHGGSSSAHDGDEHH